MAVSRLFRQNDGSAVVFLGVGILPLLIALGLILAAPHSALAAPCDPQVSGYGPTTTYIPLLHPWSSFVCGRQKVMLTTLCFHQAGHSGRAPRESHLRGNREHCSHPGRVCRVR